MQETYKSSIEEKLNKICAEQGELFYEILKIPAYNNYRSLDILTKKSLTNKLLNSLLIAKGEIGRTFHILSDSEQIYRLLESGDKISSNRVRIKVYGKKEITNNIYISNDTEYIKFYKHNKIDEIDLKNDINSKILEAYLQNTVIRYALNNNLKVPLLDLRIWNKFNINAFNLYKKFTQDEIRYMGIEISKH